MKIFLFAEYYQSYLDSFYRKNDLSRLNYHDHLEALLDDYFGGFVSYRNHFRKIGHDACLVIGNDMELQNKWLREHGICVPPWGKNKKEIVLLQVQEFNPDVFFIGSMFEYYGKFIDEVSKITPNIFAWIGCPYPKRLDLSHMRCVITGADSFMARFRRLGVNSEMMRIAFDGEIVTRLDNQRRIDVSFIGGLHRSTHSNRLMGLEHLMKKDVALRVFGYGLRKPLFPFVASPLHKVYGGELWGMDMYRTLNSSRISLNFHIDIAQGASGNMRVFEATGCGSLLMTENTPDMNQLFEVGQEIVVYDSFDDLADKIRYYLSHENELAEIAKAGQKACIERHGYDKRIMDFEKILVKYSM